VSPLSDPQSSPQRGGICLAWRSPGSPGCGGGAPAILFFVVTPARQGAPQASLSYMQTPPGLVAILKNDARAAILESVASSAPELRSSVPEALFGGDIGQIWEWEGGGHRPLLSCDTGVENPAKISSTPLKQCVLVSN